MFQCLWTLISYFLDPLWVRMFKSIPAHHALPSRLSVFSLLDGPALSSPCHASWAAAFPGWAGFLTHLKGCFWHLAMLPISPTPQGSCHAEEKKQKKKKTSDLAIGALPSATAALLAAEGLLVPSQCQELHPPPPPQLGMTRHARTHAHARGKKFRLALRFFCRPKKENAINYYSVRQ